MPARRPARTALPRGRDVLEHDAQARKPLRQRLQHPIDEAWLALEHVHGRVGHLAMHQQDQAELLHALQHAASCADVGHAGIGVGGGAGRIELDAVHEPAGLARVDLLRSGDIGQIQASSAAGSSHPGGSAARMRSRYACASAVVMIGGRRLGIMIARAKRAAVKGSTARKSSHRAGAGASHPGGVSRRLAHWLPAP